MEQGCGRKGSKRKRVALCRSGCELCSDPKHSPSQKHSAHSSLSRLVDNDDDYPERLSLKKSCGDSAAAEGIEWEEDATTRIDSDCEASKFDEVRCEKCELDDDEAQMLLCDICDRGVHMYCLCPPLASVPPGEWFCPLCTPARQIVEFPKVQTKIEDFFRIRKLPLPLPHLDGKKSSRRHVGGLSTQKKSRKLMSHVPSKDPQRRLEQLASLATALFTAGIAFSDRLTYIGGLAPRSSNRPSMEKGGMQVMGIDDKVTLSNVKSMFEMGDCPPLMVRLDRLEGFVVEADSPIKDMTIIAEYTGDVDFMRNRIHDSGNSIMGLLFTDDISNELVICPDKQGNIARFVSGINNHTSDGKRKQNVKCVRFDVDGEARALLIAIRDISKGERLYYDYNGYRQEYPTLDFV